MARPKPTSLSNLTIADLKALLAEKEIECLKARQAELEADLRSMEKVLARVLKEPLPRSVTGEGVRRVSRPSLPRFRRPALVFKGYTRVGPGITT